MTSRLNIGGALPPSLSSSRAFFVGVFSVVRLLASVTVRSPPRIYRIAYSRGVVAHGRNVCAENDRGEKCMKLCGDRWNYSASQRELGENW